MRAVGASNVNVLTARFSDGYFRFLFRDARVILDR
jgi:hypothetical protein